MFADSTTNSPRGGSGDAVAYEIEIPASGSWLLWARLYYPGKPGSNDANSFLVRIDGGPLAKLGNNRDYFRTWHFDGDGTKESGTPAPLSLGQLAAGMHTIQIEKREVASGGAPRLDVLCLTQNPDITPDDAAACAAGIDCSGPGMGSTTSSTTSTTSSTTTSTSTSTTEAHVTTTYAAPTTTLLIVTTTTLPAPPPPPVVDVVCVRAAEARQLSGSMTLGSAYAAGDDSDVAGDSLGARLLYADSGQNAFSGGRGDEVEYEVFIPEAGEWFVWGHLYYPGRPYSNDANSFFVRVDGGPRLKLGNKNDRFRQWHFDGDGSSTRGGPSPLSVGVLSSGLHSIVVEKREVQPIPPRLDLICLSQEPVEPSADQVCAALGSCITSTTLPVGGPSSTTSSTSLPPTTSTSTSTTTSTSTSTTTLPVVTTSTTLMTTSTTLPAPDVELFCISAGNDPTALFNGAMTADSTFAGGNDSDPYADSLGDVLLYADSSSSAFRGGSSDWVEYLIDFPSAAHWYFWGRFYYPSAPGSNGPNSFFLSLDNNAPLKIGNNKERFRTWHFDGDGTVEIGDPKGLDLGYVTAGLHTVVIEKREVSAGDKPRMDALCFSKQAKIAPADSEACSAMPGCTH